MEDERVVLMEEAMTDEASTIRPDYSAFAALQQIRKEHDSRNSPFPSFASVFETQNCQEWIVKKVHRDNTINRYRLVLSAPTSKKPKGFLFEHTPNREDALRFGTNLVTLLKYWPFDEIKSLITRCFLVQLATEMTSIPATVDLSAVALGQEKCVSDIDYFVRDDHSYTILIPTRYQIAVSLSDVNVEVDVPKVPSYVHFRPRKEKPRSSTHHESAEAQLARRIVQWICWKLRGSIATPQTMRQEVNRLLERSFLKTRLSIYYTSDSHGRHMVGFNTRYFNTELGSYQLYTHRMTGMGLNHWENIDNLPDYRYGRSGDPQLPEGLEAEARRKCEMLILLAKRICSEMQNFEGTSNELYEQITRMKEPHMGTSRKSYIFEQILNTDALKPTPRKRKRPLPEQLTSQKEPAVQLNDTRDSTSAVQQWACDPDSLTLMERRPSTITSKFLGNTTVREQARKTALSQRPPWLVDILDMDQNPPSHPDYDPRTLFIPKAAMDKLPPLEKWYWGVKQKLWDTIVFVQIGKYYELFENDATIGHQMCDLQLTDRNYMRSVRVFYLPRRVKELVAEGYRVAVVDRVEPASKEVRKRDGLGATKIKQNIQRKLTKVITGGTVVDTDIIDDEMSIYCAAIKESEQDGQPAFGIAFVDAASGHFSLTDFVDDDELTKFETFIAQIRPRELLLEKSCISTKALRILKNNSAPTTLWNHLKSGKEFWTADTTCREIDTGQYFINEEGDNSEAWPTALQEAIEKELVMSAYGTLLRYLRTLQIERELMTLKNVSWYDPIKNASSLVLDGKTLNNLGVFANPFDRGPNGTLFSVLNRCITPFGKRMFQQWLCHPLIDAAKINSRLDAVESLNADPTVRDQFVSNLTKIPDLERLISRIHAGSCKVQDFVRVINGFEEINHTVNLVRDTGSGEGIVGQLISNMPEMAELIKYWNTAFDHAKAKEAGLLIPERGEEDDFDESQDLIGEILADLDTLLKNTRKELGSNTIKYKYVDNGRKIYQFEVPIEVKGIPKDWDQISAYQKFKRYNSPELETLVCRYQGVQESHERIVKEVSSRFLKKFDETYESWLAAIKIIAHLDCLMSLAIVSSTLGEPACRPTFVDEQRTVIEFQSLRYPCILPNVPDFIPNDIKLGGDTANISLLTGANASGKSTILRTSCLAVVMAQIGCFVPASTARLTPIDSIISRLGVADNIFAARSTFFVELAETKKILSEATSRSLIILDELGRGTSSYDGVAVAQASLHHLATHIGCIGFFTTHYLSLAAEFSSHPEICNRRMRIRKGNDHVTFLYKLEDGVAEGSFGMYCASMCGIPLKVVERAEVAGVGAYE